MILAFWCAPSDANGQLMRLGNEEYGVRARVGFLGGETVGRLNSLTHFEVMPYLRTPNGMLLSDFRFFVSDGEVGGNVGIGYRELIPEMNRVFGGIVWYDIDQLSGETAQQVTVSLETYGDWVDGLANIYIPVGNEEVGELQASNERFVGNQLLFDQTGRIGDVLGGGDIQIGVKIPSRFAADNNIRAFAGAYHYSGDSVEDINGVLARVEGTFFNMVDAQVKVTNDDTFGTNVLFGVAIGLTRGLRSNLWRTQPMDAINRYPTRQYNAVVVDSDVTRTGVAALNPETGNPISFTHVSSGASGLLSGSFENPHNDLQLALNEDSDYYIVRGNSVFTGPDAELTLGTGDRVLGNSADFQHALQADGAGNINLPTIIADSDAPILRGTTGNTVTLASNSEFRGFTIDGTTQSGIVLDGINNAIVSNVTVLDATQDGILVRDISGSVSVLDTNVDSSGNSALRIDGVTGQVIASGDFTSDSGQALLLENAGADANIDLTAATFSNDMGNGLAFNNVGGTVALSGVSLVDSSANGINIDGGTGTIRFTGDTIIEGAAGDAIRVHNSDANVEFENLTILNATGAGVSIFGNANTGSFAVTGSTTIDGATDGIRIGENAGTTDFGRVEIRNRQNHGVVIDETEGQVVFNNELQIANEQSATDSAIEITGSDADIVFAENVNVTDVTGDAAVSLRENAGTIGFADLDVTTDSAIGVQVVDSETLNIIDGEVSTTNAAAFDIEDADTLISIESVSVDGGPVGIRLQDVTGSFVVTGIVDESGSGGSIVGTTNALLVENAGTIGLRSMTFDDNQTTFSVDTAERFALWDSGVTGSSVLVADMLNVNAIEFLRSSFSDNASVFDWRANADEQYDWLLSEVTVDSGAASALRAVATGDADLAVTIQNSVFTSTATARDLLSISGSGLLTVAMTTNDIQTSGSDATLLNIQTNSSTDLSRITVFNNLFTSTGSSTTAIDVTTGGPSELLIEQNGIGFQGDRGIGMAFDFAGSSTLGLYSNIISDEFDGATGVLFRSVQGPSRLEILSNELSFANLGGLSDRGFIFETITGDVTLIGGTNNIVSGASTPVFVPSGRTNGSFVVNGVAVP